MICNNHIFSKWYPYSRNEKWRNCVREGCQYKEIVEVKS